MKIDKESIFLVDVAATPHTPVCCVPKAGGRRRGCLSRGDGVRGRESDGAAQIHGSNLSVSWPAGAANPTLSTGVRFLGVSQVTEDFLAWVCRRLAAEGKQALLLVWDNAPWHGSQRVRAWIRAHNRQAKQHGGVRIVVCYLPSKSPWLNRIEPKWVHGKKAILEPERRLNAAEVQERVCTYYGCKHEAPLRQQTEKKVA
jgi:transposase